MDVPGLFDPGFGRNWFLSTTTHERLRADFQIEMLKMNALPDVVTSFDHALTLEQMVARSSVNCRNRPYPSYGLPLLFVTADQKPGLKQREY